MPKRPTIDEGLTDEPTPTAQPRDRPAAVDDDDDRVVPLTNVGGAAPTPRGHDSGGDLPGYEDDLTNLVEPEPPEAAEESALHVRWEEDAAPRGEQE
jgi:hypothetical protein